MTSVDRARQLHDELEAALEAVRDHERVSAHLARAAQAEEAARDAAAVARQGLGAEHADVRRLESFSATRIWATLCGRRDTDLDRERAELQAAEYAAARAGAWLATSREETERVRRELDALGDVAARRERALAAKEEWLRSTPGPSGVELSRIAAEVATAHSALAEVAEAAGAASSAASHLAAATASLDSAGGWSTYDTFFGGGLLTDAIKYDRMDEAERLLQAADRALRHLAVELRDVGVQGAVDGLAVDGLTQALDVWFDNVFSDWAVRNRIEQARDRAHEALRTVEEVRRQLAAREVDLRTRRDHLLGHREQLLAAPVQA